MTGLVSPPGVSAHPGGPLFGMEWEDVSEAGSVVFVKTLNATSKHEMQTTFVIHFSGHILTVFPPLGSVKVRLVITMVLASIFDITDSWFQATTGSDYM